MQGTILEGLADSSTGSISADDQQLTKSTDTNRMTAMYGTSVASKLDKAYSFLPVSVPGGVATPEQWLAVDELAIIAPSTR